MGLPRWGSDKEFACQCIVVQFAICLKYTFQRYSSFIKIHL